MDPLTIVRRRLHHQRLTTSPFGSPEQAVHWLGAVQAQEFAEAKWSVGQRVLNGTDARVGAALDEGSLVRTHVMRPTWHFVSAADIRWILRLTAPRIHQLNKYWYGKLGLEPAVLDRAHLVFAEALAGGASRTRVELAKSLHSAGIRADGLRMGYLLMHAELEELICSGPRRGRQHTYALFDDRVAPAPDRPRDEALAELCLRFYRSHGPATVHDFTKWSSLTVADARLGLASAGDQLSTFTADGTTWWSGTDPVPDGPTGAFLIPMYDETVVAYHDPRVVLAASATRADLLQRPIVIDGYTVGTWKREVGKRLINIDAALFVTLDPARARALDEAVERFGRFLELEATLTSHPATE